MEPDPIVDEIRAIRDEFARRFNYDIAAIAQALNQASKEQGRQLVTLPPRRTTDESEPRKAG